MQDCKLTISIVTYKTPKDELLKIINCVLKSIYSYKIFIVDNSPQDTLKDFSTDCRIEYIFNPTNPGYGAGHNIAIKKAIKLNSDYHLVLNPDIYFNEGTLEALIDFMERNKNIGHIMPKILYPDGSLQYLCKTNPTFFDLFARGFMPHCLKIFFKYRMDKYEYKNRNYDEIIYDIPYLSGCFMFLRTSILKEVGYFDEKIFMYLEDADLTRRFLQVSNTAYFPEAKAYHHFAKLTHRKLKFKWITIQSAVTYFNKWGWLKSIV